MQSGIKKKDYVDLELLHQQLTGLDESIALAKEQLDHTYIACDVLKELEKTKEESSLLIPLGSGMFLPAKVKSGERLKVAVGAGVVVTKSFQEAFSYLEKQQEKLEAFQAKSVELYDKVAARALLLQEKIEKDMKGV